MVPGTLSRWLSLAVLLLLIPGARASLPEAETVVETRFAGTLGGRWRITRSHAELVAPNLHDWLPAQTATGSRSALLGDRLMLKVRPGSPYPDAAVARAGARADRQVAPGLWILQSNDPWAAIHAATLLAREPDVQTAVPVMRRPLALHRSFAPRPGDPYFTNQWHLENRSPDGQRLGPDTNPREAWSITRGEGVTLGIGDDGFEVLH
ncbi:MAG: hypothetical protein IT580_21120, partial [Verrucomicrobiales bacterium]|nr:hypothetical protein [Verrucomicrobiales bacterium]